MSRLDKLKRLKDEISRLFYEGLNENAIFDQLRANEQFADVSRGQVQSFYTHIQEKSNAETENERQIAECEQQIVEYQQRKTELEVMVKYQQNSNKFLIYDESSVIRFSGKHFWQGRFFMTVEYSRTNPNVYTINVQDLFQGIAKLFTTQKHSRFLMPYSFMFPFILFYEYGIPNGVTYLRLVKFDFESETLQVIQSFEFNAFCRVLVNASDPSKFLLQKGDDLNKCNLVDGKIQIGKKLTLDSNFNIYCGSYFDEQLCILQFGRPFGGQSRYFPLTQVKMLLYDLERNENSTQDIDTTPENIVCFRPYVPNYSAWVRNTIFLIVQFRLTEIYGFIFTNPKVRTWKFVEFSTNLRINCIQAFANGVLMVYSEEERQSKTEIYKLQMCKPDFLRNMAWTKIVKLFKEAKIENPYEEARQYLPLNSEIQSFIFTED